MGSVQPWIKFIRPCLRTWIAAGCLTRPPFYYLVNTAALPRSETSPEVPANIGPTPTTAFSPELDSRRGKSSGRRTDKVATPTVSQPAQKTSSPHFTTPWESTLIQLGRKIDWVVLTPFYLTAASYEKCWGRPEQARLFQPTALASTFCYGSLGATILGALPVNDFKNATIESISEKLCPTSGSISNFVPCGPRDGTPR